MNPNLSFIENQYQGIEVIARRQLSTLYTGIHQQTGENHCLKVCLDKQTSENLKHEYSFLKANPSPFFPKVIAWEHIDNQKDVLIREYIPGKPLNELGGKLNQQDVLIIAAQIAQGLAKIHFMGLCFGDISTNNFIYNNGKITFIDFEFIAKRHDNKQKTRGTPAFMAPELFYGNPPTIQSDLYGLGVILYYLITGKLPFRGQTYQELISSHLLENIFSPAKENKEFSEEFGLLVLRLLNKEPGERFLEANELIKILNRTCKTNFQTEPAPESLAAQEKIRVLQGYSFIADAVKQLENKNSKSEPEWALLCQLYLKLAKVEQVFPILEHLSKDDSLYFKIQALNSKGQYQEALELIPNDKGEKYLLPKSTALYYLGKSGEAQDLLEQTIKTFKEAKQDKELVIYQNHLGNLLLFNRQLGPAINQYEKAYLAAKKLGMVHSEATSLMNLANSYLAKYEWTKALEAYEKAKRIFELMGNQLEATRTSLNLSGLLRFLGHLERAREILKETKGFLENFGNHHLTLYSLLLEADLEKKQKNFNKAKECLEKGEAILKDHYTATEQGDLLTSRVEVSLDLEESLEIEKSLDQIRDLLKKQEDTLLEKRFRTVCKLYALMGEGELNASTFIALCKDLVNQGDIEFALDNLCRAIRLCEKTEKNSAYETLMEYLNELLKFCDKKISADYRERFFFFYKHHPQESKIKPSSEFLLKQMMETMREVMSELDINILVKKILHLMMEVTHTDRGFVIFNEQTPSIAYSHKIDPFSLTNEDKPEIISWTLTKQALTNKKPLMTIDALGDERFVHTQSVHQLRLRSILILPFIFRGEVLGAVYLDSTLKSEQLKRENLEYLEALADQIGIAIHNARKFETTKNELHLVQRDLDEKERELRFKNSYDNFIGRSPKIINIFKMLDKIIDTPVPVCIHGESGTGKEMIAKIIHYNSKRKDKKLVSINCAAIPEQLLESELFGHVRGAFTGATDNKTGLFEIADGGTLFLDEIGDLPLNMQVKLLRALQDMEIRPIGGHKSKKVDVRIICATHQNLKELIKLGKFREDLYYRLNVTNIEIPSLRERKEDIPLFVNTFLKKFAKENDVPEKKLSDEALSILLKYSWPGNVRELENMIYTLSVLSENVTINRSDLENKKELFLLPEAAIEKQTSGSGDPDLIQAIDKKQLSLAQAKQCFEKQQIERVLGLYQGRVVKAAEHLQMERSQVSRLIKRYQIDKMALPDLD